MEAFSSYLAIKRKLLICCMFWIFSAAEANTILEVVGSTVMLPCDNESLSKLSQLTWKMNGFNLLSYRPEGNLHISPQAVRLSINMSLSEDQLYKLIIERVEKSHTGNYTCETNTQTGVWEKTWELIITEANTILEVVGSTVMLPCNNESLSKLSQLTWKMNGTNLLSYRPEGNLHISPQAVRLSINMSLSEDQLYKLIIERVEKSHTGNYTCETNTQTGAWEKTWELIITEHEKAFVIPVAAIVRGVCCVIFIFAVIIVRRACKHCAEYSNQSPTAKTWKQPEDVYETDVSQRSSHRQS